MKEKHFPLYKLRKIENCRRNSFPRLKNGEHSINNWMCQSFKAKYTAGGEDDLAPGDYDVCSNGNMSEAHCTRTNCIYNENGEIVTSTFALRVLGFLRTELLNI